MSDKRIEQLVKTWLSVIALHVNYQRYYEAAKVGFASGNELVSFPYSKCGAVCCDPAELVQEAVRSTWMYCL